MINCAHMNEGDCVGVGTTRQWVGVVGMQEVLEEREHLGRFRHEQAEYLGSALAPSRPSFCHFQRVQR